jgi:hypothetical protein
MLYSALWNGLGLASLAAIVELASIAIRELRGGAVRDIVLSVFTGILCALLTLTAIFLPLLYYSDYVAWFVEQVSPIVQLLLFPLVLSVVTFTFSFVVARFFKNGFPRTVICAVAVLCSTTAIFLPIGYDWLACGMAFAERLLV